MKFIGSHSCVYSRLGHWKRRLALYDSQLADLLSFCNVIHLYHCLGVCNTTIAVAYSIFLGCNWFRMCSTGLEDNPEAAVHLSSLNQWLFFAASQVNAIYTQLPSGRFHDRNPLYVCTVRNNEDLTCAFGT